MDKSAACMDGRMGTGSSSTVEILPKGREVEGDVSDVRCPAYIVVTLLWYFLKWMSLCHTYTYRIHGNSKIKSC